MTYEEFKTKVEEMFETVDPKSMNEDDCALLIMRESVGVLGRTSAIVCSLAAAMEDDAARRLFSHATMLAAVHPFDDSKNNETSIHKNTNSHVS